MSEPGTRKQTGSRAPAVQLPRGYGRPRQFHMAWRPCIRTACGFYSVVRACGATRAVKRPA
jgi:hypothetical protein